MSSGQQAAEETKSAFKGIYQATEDVRKNVNSFADDLIGGNKTHQSTGFSKDAKAIGNEIDKSVNNSTSETTGTSTSSTH